MSRRTNRPKARKRHLQPRGQRGYRPRTTLLTVPIGPKYHDMLRELAKKANGTATGTIRAQCERAIAFYSKVAHTESLLQKVDEIIDHAD